MLTLTPKQRRELRAQAHSLHPVVSVGQQGLTPQVMHEIDIALRAHALVKVRVFSEDRAEREAMLTQIAEALDAAPVQHIGKLLIVWRPQEEAAAAAPRRRARKVGARTGSAKTAPPKGRADGSGERVSRRERGSSSEPRSAKVERFDGGDGAPDARRRRRRAPESAVPRSTGATARRGADSGRDDTRAPRGKSAPNPRRRRRAS